MKLWTGQSISEFGSQISQLAIPWLAAVGLDASPVEFSLLGVFGFLPFIVFALPAGVWVDRLQRRPILILGDAARAVLLAAVPILWAAGALQMWELLAVQFLVGLCTVFFDVAYQSYLPSLVDREQLVDGNSKLQVTASAAQVAGPGLSGVLIAAITAPYAIVLDVVSFVVSTLFMLRIRRPESPPEREETSPKPKMLPELKEGLNYVVGHSLLRPIAICTGTSNFFGQLLFAIFLLYAVRVLHMSSFTVGVVFAMFGVGAIVASLTANRLQRSIGVGPVIVGSSILFSVVGFAFPLAPKSLAVLVIALATLLIGYGGVAYNIAQVSLRQAITPERLQGRMNASMRWIVWGTIPLGTLAGGAIASATTLRTAIWVGAVGSAFTFLPVLLSPVRELRELPKPVTEPPIAAPELVNA